MHNLYTIAVCDILGFSNLVETNPLDRVVDIAIGWLRKAFSHSIHKNGFPNDVPTLSELQDQTNLGIAWFSDTILLYTLRDTDKCLQSLLSTLGWLIFETIFVPETRIRCGVSYGIAYIDQENSIYVGMPLIEAYQLEREQAWSGAALTPSAVQRIPKLARNGKFPEWWVIPYKVPLKKKKYIDTLAINWTVGVHPPSFEFPHWSKQSLEPTEADWKNIHDICEKWKNTKEFHNSVCRWCK